MGLGARPFPCHERSRRVRGAEGQHRQGLAGRVHSRKPDGTPKRLVDRTSMLFESSPGKCYGEWTLPTGPPAASRELVNLH